MLPVRWMSPESVKYGRFTTESDVWALGMQKVHVNVRTFIGRFTTERIQPELSQFHIGYEGSNCSQSIKLICQCKYVVRSVGPIINTDI